MKGYLVLDLFIKPLAGLLEYADKIPASLKSWRKLTSRN